MTDSAPTYTAEEHAQHLVERAALVDAARESSRTFDKAVLTFASAVFGFSIAFLKDVAPNPIPCTLKWLGASWALFSLGLLFIMLSFLTSHKACMREIEISLSNLGKKEASKEKNGWGTATTSLNILCIVCLFCGLSAWSAFAIENLNQRETMNKPNTPPSQVERGYTPPPPPARTPPPPPTAPLKK